MSRSFSRRQLARRAVGLGTAIAAGSLVAESNADPAAAAGTADYVPLPATAPTDGQLYGYSAALASTVTFNPTGAQILAQAVNQSGIATQCPAAKVTAIPGTTIAIPPSPTQPVEISAAITVKTTSAHGCYMSLEANELNNGFDTPQKFKVFVQVPAAIGMYFSAFLPTDLGRLGVTTRTRTFSLYVDPVAASITVLNNSVGPTPTVITARAS